MKAITIRKDGKLLCFGPDNGMYEPGVPDGAINGIEDDYDVVQAEFIANLPPIPTKDELDKADLVTMLEVLNKNPDLLKQLKLALATVPVGK